MTSMAASSASTLEAQIAGLQPAPLDVYSCRSVSSFEKIGRVGSGTYGTVYKARDKDTSEIVALKKLRMSNEKEGFPLTSIREIKILKSIDHPNIVRLKDVVVGSKPDSIFLAFEYCDHDLAYLMERMPLPWSVSEVKCILLQLLRAVAHLHARFVLHRDLKLTNLLVNNQGILKLADFGLARLFGQPLRAYTPNVVTLWYRAPELLLGLDKYHAAADCWAIGCIFGELVKHRPLLPGKTELEQIELIYKLLGAPNDRIWPEYSALPMTQSVTFANRYKYNELNSEFQSLSPAGLDLLKGLLTYDPAKRITAQKALEHPYLFESPLPKQPELMPILPSFHPVALPAVPLPAAGPLIAPSIPISSSSSSSSSLSSSSSSTSAVVAAAAAAAAGSLSKRKADAISVAFCQSSADALAKLSRKSNAP